MSEKPNREGRARLVALTAFCMVLCCQGPDMSLDCSSVELRVHDSTCTTADVIWDVWSVTWEDKGHEVVSLPWLKAVDLCDGSVEVRAKRECPDDGIVTVEIYIDEVLKKSATGEGPGAAARVESWIG